MNSTRGFSLIEILVASSVFIIGFTLLMFLLNNMTQQLSFKDTLIAKNLATKYMDRALLTNDLASQEFIEEVISVKYRVNQSVVISGKLAAIEIVVIRQSSGKILIELYSEKYLHQSTK